MAILGTGDLAHALHAGGVDRDDTLFFAAGVSNSGETRESEYDREVNLLRAQHPDRRLVYFSSLAVYYSDGRYSQHKRFMEGEVKALFGSYTIMRLGNIDWGHNPHTLINTLRERERLYLPQDIQNVYRYIVSLDEFLHWVRLIPRWPCEMNVPGRRMLVREIYQEFVIGARESV